MKPKLLVVPHIYAEDVSIREIELARRLHPWFEVYCLKWADAVHVDGAGGVLRRAAQLRRGLASLLTPRRVRLAEDGVRYVEMPLLQPILLRRAIGTRASLEASRAFNTRALEATVAALGIDRVLLATNIFRIPTRSRAPTVYDFVDWFAEEAAARWEIVDTDRFLGHLRERADGLLAVSEPLRETLAERFGLACRALPNGADLARLRATPPEDVDRLRRAWGLEGALVLSYIGNHVRFSGIDFVLDAFELVRERIPRARLMLVGPIGWWLPRLRERDLRGVVITGAVAPAEVPAYFAATDIGLMPQEKSALTDLAFQIKTVEYSACRKFVVSTPLACWERLAWPNVALVEREPAAWADAICALEDAEWDSEWDALVEPYDWDALAAELADALAQVGGAALTV